MESKIDYIVEQIGGINKTLEFQAKQLEEHIQRTELLEKKFEPVEDHVKFIRKLMSGMAWIASIIVPILAVITYFKH